MVQATPWETPGQDVPPPVPIKVKAKRDLRLLRAVILVVAEVAALVAISLGVYLEWGLAPTLLTGGIVTLGICFTLELPDKPTAPDRER